MKKLPDWMINVPMLLSWELVTIVERETYYYFAKEGKYYIGIIPDENELHFFTNVFNKHVFGSLSFDEIKQAIEVYKKAIEPIQG